MKLAIITALHERYKLTRLFLDYYQNLDIEGVELGLFCTCTTDEHKMHNLVSEYPEWQVSTAENMPLTRKFAANMPNVKDWKPDALMIMGSDDFASVGYIERAIKRIDQHQYIGNSLVHYINLGTDQMIMQSDLYGRPIGAGRMLSRSLLDRMKWNLWLDDETTGLDKSMAQHLAYHGVEPVMMSQHGLLDCKELTPYGHSANRTAWETVRRWPHEPVEHPDRYLDEHFPTLKQTLLSW